MGARRRHAKNKLKDSGRVVRTRQRVLAVGCFALAAVLTGLAFADWWNCLPEGATPAYVGRQSCIQCHSQEAELYHNSHHDLAMDLATPDTVLGDFNAAELTHHGLTSRMFLQDGKYMIHTEGPDGELSDFQIKYVFGVDPLQQYMVEFDRPASLPAEEIARLQVLRISWDTARNRWFYLAPPDVDEKLAPDDDLHWTGIAQRWNNMCADCHSTNFQKNFDPATKTYHTTFGEIDVSCEACHGPGSLHVDLAQAQSLFWDRKRGYGLPHLKDRNTDIEIQACAQCHSRRRIVHPDFRPGEDFYDHFANELLMEHTYHADGQILDEVYVHGSFIQSKMYRKGIRCTDCHDPHTARLKQTGNEVCTSCHQHSAGKYDSPNHHFHPPGSPGAACVNCHMPETTYMGVDPRRDHSLRVPRPDVSLLWGTPNACSGCHLDRGELPAAKRGQLREYADWLTASRNGDQQVSAAIARIDTWARNKFEQWYGAKDDLKKQPAEALLAARRGERMSEQALIGIARSRTPSAILRATALAELTRFHSSAAINAAAGLLTDINPQVRAAALANLESLRDPTQLAELVSPLLEDPVRLVRTEAARLLAGVASSELRDPQRRARRRGLDELVGGLMVNNDRAAAHLSMGVLLENMRDDDGATKAYRTAIHVESAVTGPRTNLAAVYDRRAANANAEVARLSRFDRQAAQRALEQAVQLAQSAAEMRREELDLLARDAGLVPDNGAIQYRYGLSLYLHDRLPEAETALGRACELAPNNADFSFALALFLQKQGRFSEALRHAERSLTLRPDAQMYRNVVSDLRRQLPKGSNNPPGGPNTPAARQ